MAACWTVPSPLTSIVVVRTPNDEAPDGAVKLPPAVTRSPLIAAASVTLSLRAGSMTSVTPCASVNWTTSKILFGSPASKTLKLTVGPVGMVTRYVSVPLLTGTTPMSQFRGSL